MQANPFPFVSSVFNQVSLNDGGLSEGIESPGVFLFLSILFSQGQEAAAMDLSKVGEKILSSVRSARSLGLLPPASHRPEVPARAAAAAAVARALAGFPHQRFSLPSGSEELSSIYGSRPNFEVVELEEDFYQEDFDPVRHVLEHIPWKEDELASFECQATLRLAQLDRIAERLSCHVMEHHEEMVKGMHLVRELEKDLKVANVICMNGRRHVTSSMQEVSRDLIVTSNSKKKHTLMELLPILNELRHALEMQVALESHVEQGNYFKVFQVLSEYLQLLDSLSELSVVQEMSCGVEVWLGQTLQKLDALLLGVCQEFEEDSYITVVDAYALIGDISGLADKIQSFFMQEVLSETHSVLKYTIQEDEEIGTQNNRHTYSDLCLQIHEPKFRQCLLRTLAVLFRLMSSYYSIMGFQLENKVLAYQTSVVNKESSDLYSHSEEVHSSTSVTEKSSNFPIDDSSSSETIGRTWGSSHFEDSTTTICLDGATGISVSTGVDSFLPDEARNDGKEASSSGSPWYQLRKDATVFVSQTLQRGRKNLWQLTTSRVSVLLSSVAVYSTSIHQFVRNYEDLNVFILAGEAFCGVEAFDFREKLKVVCENFYIAFHRQNMHALKMVLEKETWLKMPSDTMQLVSFAGLLGDGAPLITSSVGNSISNSPHQSRRSAYSVDTGSKNSVFSDWLRSGNPFLLKVTCNSKYGNNTSLLNGTSISGERDGYEMLHGDKFSTINRDSNQNGSIVSEDENEDLLADFIDEDSQLPSRIAKPNYPRNHSSHCNDEEIALHTGSSLCLLRLMDKYARLMQKLEIVNVEFFKGICQLFEAFFHFLFETFGQHYASTGGKVSSDYVCSRLKAALSRITQDCDQWVKPQLLATSSSPTSLNSPFSHVDVIPTGPPITGTSFSLKERCAAADTISLVARILHRSKAHLQSMIIQYNTAMIEDFYVHLVDVVPDLVEHIHKTTVRLLLRINGYADRIAGAKWEVKELGLEHNSYVDLLLGEFKHYKTRLAHGGIDKEVQDLLLEYGLDIVAETLVEGLSRVKRCTDEGRALMSLDMQVLINGLQHFVSANVKPKLQIVETFIKAYYLPETEFVHWARAHPVYSKIQITGLINLVANTKNWKRKVRLEVLEKIE